jgi:hypothetical protein
VKEKFKIYLDYIPLLILLGSALYLLWTIANSDIMLVWKHYVGFAFLVLTILLFVVRHLFGVLCLGLTLLLGVTGLLSYSPAITITTFWFGDGGDNSLTLLKFQPVFVLWIILYFIVSGRHLTGVLSKEYWVEVKNKQR